MSTKCSSGAGPYPLCPFGTSPLDKGSRPRGVLPNPSLLPAKPSEAGSPGRGGARERTQFSPPGGNGVEWTLRRRAAEGKGTRRPRAAKSPQCEKRSLCNAPVGIPGYQNGWVFHLRPGVRSPCAYFFENGAPGSARGCWKRAAHQKTITFFATLRKYFKEILLCNNSNAMLRFCYTFP